MLIIQLNITFLDMVMVWTYANMIYIIYVVCVAQQTIAFISRFSIPYAKKSPKYKMSCIYSSKSSYYLFNKKASNNTELCLFLHTMQTFPVLTFLQLQNIQLLLLFHKKRSQKKANKQTCWADGIRTRNHQIRISYLGINRRTDLHICQRNLQIPVIWKIYMRYQHQLFVKRVELRNVNRALWYTYIQTK